MGVTGQKILRAILAGERNADKLAEMRNERIQASREEIAASLTGNWRPELLFALKQEVDRYDFCQRQIAECEQKVEQHLGALPARAKETGSPVEPSPQKRKRAGGNSPSFALDKELIRITGVDFSRIDGFNVMIAASCRRRTHGQQAWEDFLPENGIAVGEQRTWEPRGQSLLSGFRRAFDRTGQARRLGKLHYRNLLAPSFVRSARKRDTP